MKTFYVVVIVLASAAICEGQTRVEVFVQPPSHTECQFPPPIQIAVAPVTVQPAPVLLLLPSMVSPSAVSVSVPSLTVQPPPVQYQPPCVEVTVTPPPVSHWEVTAASCAQTDVSAALDVAQDGDWVKVPAGACTWTAGVTVTTFVRLMADGAVTITDQAPVNSNLFTLAESALGSVRLEDFSITQGNAHTNTNGVVVVEPTPGGQPVLITGMTFHGLTGNAIRVHSPRGVVWNNTFNGVVFGPNCFNNASAIRHKPGGDGTSWTRPATFGNTDDGTGQLYIEGNTLNDVLEAIDVDDHARTVVRFNTLINSAMVTHGDTSFPGGRYVEIYRNTFVRDVSLKPECDGGTLPTNNNGLMTWRAGTGFVIANAIPDQRDGYWGDKSEISLRVDALRRASGGPYACWTNGVPFPAQTGWGFISGGTQAGTTGHYYDRQPIYFAANTGAGNYMAPSVMNFNENGCGASAPSVLDYVQADREFFRQMVAFDGTSGTGTGTRANRPASTTNGVGYWTTDAGGNWDTTNSASEDGCLDIVRDGAWVNCAYMPYTYPHPLRQ